MKKASLFVKTLAMLGAVLPTLAQTAPKAAAPQPTTKTTTANGLVKKYEGPKVAESTQKLGQKFVDKSREDTSPIHMKVSPVKVAPAPKD